MMITKYLSDQLLTSKYRVTSEFMFLGRKAMATPYMHRAEIRWLTFSVAILKLRLPNFAHM